MYLVKIIYVIYISLFAALYIFVKTNHFMKKAVCLLLIIITACSDFKKSYGKKTHVESALLKGNVKQIKHTYYKALNKFGEIIQGDMDTTKAVNLMVYNGEGNIIHAVEYDKEGNLSLIKKSKYGTNGNILEWKGYLSDGSIKDSSIYEYNEEENIKALKSYLANGELNFKESVTYDENGNQSEIFHCAYDSDLDNTFRVFNTFDNKGNVTKTIFTSLGLDTTARETRKYDENSRLIEYTTYSPNDRVTSKTLYKYDENGNNCEVKSYGLDNELKNIYIYKYELDKKGNWIKQYTFHNDDPKTICVRKITYFED